MCVGNDFIWLFYTALACMRVGCCVRRRSLGCVWLAGRWTCSPRWRCRCHWRLAFGSGRDFFSPSLTERLEFSLSAHGLVVRVHGFNVLMWRAASKRAIRCRWLHVQGKWVLYNAAISKGLLRIHIYNSCEVCLGGRCGSNQRYIVKCRLQPSSDDERKRAPQTRSGASASDRPPTWAPLYDWTPVGPIPVDIFLSRELELEPSASTRRLRAQRHHSSPPVENEYARPFALSRPSPHTSLQVEVSTVTVCAQLQKWRLPHSEPRMWTSSKAPTRCRSHKRCFRPCLGVS